MISTKMKPGSDRTVLIDEQPIDPNKHTVKVQIGEKDEEIEFREGGLGWLVIFGCGLSSLSSFGMVNSYGVFQTYYETEMFPNVESSKLSIIGACQASIIYFFVPLVMPLVHAFGIRQVLLTGALLYVISFFGLSTTQSNSLWKCYLFQGILYSIGGALQFSCMMVLPSEWFKRKRATAFGVASGFVGVGGVVWPIIFKKMIEKHGFKWTVMTIGFVYIPLGLATVILMPQKLDKRYVHKEKCFANSRWNWQNIRSLPQAYCQLFKEWERVMKDVRFSIILLINLLCSFGAYPAIFYIDFFGSVIAPTAKISAYLTVIYVVLGAPGRIIPAIIADKIGRINSLLICTFALGISVFVLWIPSIEYESIGIFVAFVVLFGFFVGPIFSLFPASLGQLFGIEGSEARLGLFMITATPGPILGCLIAGSFIPVDSNDHQLILNAFYKLVIYSGVVLTCCAVLLLGVRLSISKKPVVFI